MDTPIIVLLLAVAGTAVIYVIVEQVRRARTSAPAPSGQALDVRAAAPHTRDTAAWLVDTTRYFRRLGFFSDDPASDEALAAELGRAIEREWGVGVDELTSDPQEADMFVVGHDRSRVYRPPSKYFHKGDDTYVEIVERCAALAPSVLPVADVRESWDGDRGPVLVQLAFAGQPQRYTVTDPKYFDAGIVTFLNNLAAPAPIALRVCDNQGMPDFVVALRHTDAQRLTEERGWSFWDTVAAH